MVVSEITVYDALKGMLGEEKAPQALAGIKEEVAKEVEIQKKGLATKEDIYALRVEIAESKAEIIRWMFIFWLGTLGIISGLMSALFHAFMR